MRPTSAASDPWEIVVFLVSICFQVSAVAFQKLPRMAAVPGRGIAIQDDRRKPVLAASEQPHKWLSLGSAPFLVQYLNPGFICHCKASFQQLTVKVIIHWLEIVLWTVDDPVGKCSAADLSSILFPVFLLPVKWKPVGILLIHSPCYSGCWGRTFQVDAIYINIGIFPESGRVHQVSICSYTFLFRLLIVPGDTFVFHKASVLFSIRRTEISARYISINDSSTEDSLRRWRSIMAVLKGRPLSLGTFSSTSPAVVWRFRL